MTDKEAKKGKNNLILYFVLFLFFAGILFAVLVATDVIKLKKNTTGGSGGSAKNEEPKLGKKIARNQDLRRINKNTYLLPREFFEKEVFPNAIMNDGARTLIQKKYLPQMIGVPGTGQPFRLSLPRPISDKIVYEIIEAVTKDNPEDMFFIKTMNPPALFGYKRQISGEMTSYCNHNADSCDPVDIYFYQGIYSHDEPNV